MIKFLRAVSFVSVALLLPLSLFAAEPKYDPSSEVTLNGSATYVADHPSGGGWTGVYTIMRTGGSEIEVHLAPGVFLENGGIELKAGDTLKVIGSRVHWKGAEIVLGRQITVKDKMLELRDKSGAPLW